MRGGGATVRPRRRRPRRRSASTASPDAFEMRYLGERARRARAITVRGPRCPATATSRRGSRRHDLARLGRRRRRAFDDAARALPRVAWSASRWAACSRSTSRSRGATSPPSPRWPRRSGSRARRRWSRAGPRPAGRCSARVAPTLPEARRLRRARPRRAAPRTRATRRSRCARSAQLLDVHARRRRRAARRSTPPLLVVHARAATTPRRSPRRARSPRGAARRRDRAILPRQLPPDRRSTSSATSSPPRSATFFDGTASA